MNQLYSVKMNEGRKDRMEGGKGQMEAPHPSMLPPGEPLVQGSSLILDVLTHSSLLG